MKIKEWVAVGLMLGVATASRSLGATETSLLDHLQGAETSARDIAERAKGPVDDTGSRWPEMDRFQMALWRAMALDPTQPILVPPSQVPKSLFAAQLNRELLTLLAEIRKSPVPSELGATGEFEQYLATLTQILELRSARKFPEARAIAKRGILDQKFELLMQKIGKPESDKSQMQEQVQQLLNRIEKTREAWNQEVKESERKNIFGSSNQQFAWGMIAIILGFVLGIAAFRISPDFFQKFLHATEIATPSPPQFNTEGRLDYARWLRDLEEHLTRFKNSQQTHERRIEEVVGVSEKITQQALSLYSDPRIRGEAALETRMAGLVREVQHQFEQGKRLASGERIQIQQMLEHCLRLCDAIESGGINLDRSKSSPPPSKSA